MVVLEAVRPDPEVSPQCLAKQYCPNQGECCVATISSASGRQAPVLPEPWGPLGRGGVRLDLRLPEHRGSAHVAHVFAAEQVR